MLLAVDRVVGLLISIVGGDARRVCGGRGRRWDKAVMWVLDVLCHGRRLLVVTGRCSSGSGVRSGGGIVLLLAA